MAQPASAWSGFTVNSPISAEIAEALASMLGDTPTAFDRAAFAVTTALLGLLVFEGMMSLDIIVVKTRHGKGKGYCVLAYATPLPSAPPLPPQPSAALTRTPPPSPCAGPRRARSASWPRRAR